MEKKGITDVVEKIARGAASQQNMLGNEMTQIGRAIGDEEASAAINAANVAAVMGLGLVAGGAAMISFNADKKTKEFYGKLDTYGGLGVPMDDDCTPLSKVSFAGWKTDKTDLMTSKGKSLSSYEVIAKHVSHNQDKLISRSFNDGVPLWDIFLFSKQLVKNRVAFGLNGKYPPRLELSLQEFDMSMLTKEQMISLGKDFEKVGVRLTASGNALRVGECNISASYTGFEEALKVLSSNEYRDITALDGMRTAIKEHLTSKKMFGFEVPAYTISKEEISNLSSEEVDFLKFLCERNEIDVVEKDGSFILTGEVQNFEHFEEDFNLVKPYGDSKVKVKSFDKIRSDAKTFSASEKMTEINRELVSLKRELNGFDAIKFNFKNGRCIVQTDHGLEDIIQVLMAANRLPSGWDKGIKRELADWAKNNEIDSTYSASFVYGENQGAKNVQRTLYTRVKHEELSATAEVAPDQLLFIETGEDGIEYCTITHLEGDELNRVVAEGTKQFQKQLLEKTDMAAQAATKLDPESIQLLAEAIRGLR